MNITDLQSVTVTVKKQKHEIDYFFILYIYIFIYILSQPLRFAYRILLRRNVGVIWINRSGVARWHAVLTALLNVSLDLHARDGR